MGRLTVFVAVLLAGAALARADVIHLRDGTTREGRIVSQTDDVIVLEVSAGAAKARLTIDRADVERIEVKLTGQQVLEAEYQKRLAKLDRADAAAVIDLARWCMTRNMFDKAEELLLKLSEQGEPDFVRAHLALANMEYGRKRFEQAKGHLKAVLDKQPRNLDAKLLGDVMEQEERRAVERLLDDAVAQFNRGKFEAALQKAESFHDRAAPEDAARLLARANFPEGMKFDDFVAESRLRVPCPFCKDGTDVCGTCGGKEADAAGPLCGECGGTGRVVCGRCGGTGVKFDDAPEWEWAALVRALEQRAARDAAEFDKVVKTLEGTPGADEVVPAAARAELLVSRALRWLTVLDGLAAKKPGITTARALDERQGLEKQWQALCLRLGDLLGKKADTTWRNAEAAEAGYLSQDVLLRGARGDAVRALYFYGRTRPDRKAPYPAGAGARVDALEPLVAQLDKIIDHNAKMMKAYDLAMKHVRRRDPAAALAVLVDLVTHAAKRDLEYLSAKMEKELGGGLGELMAACRFEVGKDSGKFGETTEYERPAFVKRLISEADAAAGLAHNGYESMLRFRDSGKRNSVPTSLVRRTREQAEDARRWYRAVFEVPYPLAAAKRTEIDAQIDTMTKIINHCKRWFTTGTPTTPVPH